MGIDWKAEIEARDEMGEEEDLGDWLSAGDVDEPQDANVPLDTSFPNTLIVVNLPKVPAAKYARLRGVVDKLFDKPGANTKHMPEPTNDTDETDGMLIITYETKAAAEKAKELYHDLQLDKVHQFKVYFIDEFDAIAGYDEAQKEETPIQTSEVTDLRDWMQDEQCREMFVARYDVGENEIFWHNHVANSPELEYGGEREKRGGKVWCDSKVMWSPLGSYFATFHRPGIALWGGHKFTKRARFLHQDVKHVEFSPNEEFLLTWNGRHAAEKDADAVKIWKIVTNECVAHFPTPSFTPRGGEFPHFLWSPDGRYLARCTEDKIFVHDAQDNFEVCIDPASGDKQKRSPIKFPDGLQSFDWSPKQNVLSAWIPEKDNIPARLVLMSMPDRTELAGKNLFNVRDAAMHWQPEGRYLCVNAMRLSRSKKSGHTHLEIFRVMEKNVPVETVDLKDTLKSFHWETKGHRFCILTTDENGHGLKACFYAISEKETCQVASYDLHAGISHVHWAPAGQYLVMAAIPGGDLIFAQLDEKNKLDILHKDEHFLLTDVCWDPSSRYFISAVTQSMASGVRYQTESGYKCWSFQGRILYQQNKEKLYQVAWRPHPPTLLSDADRVKVRGDLKSFSKRYDQLDEVSREETKRLQHKERMGQEDKFTEVLDEIERYKQSKWERTGWKAAWEKLDALSQWEVRTEEVEEELEVKEELITD